jgi:hypothetical protein
LSTVQTSAVAAGDLLDRARELLEENTRTAVVDGRQVSFTVPSGRRYRFQWFWDSCFHAIVWAHIDPARAADELRALVSHQDADGLLPHIIFWDTSLVKGGSAFLESRGRLDWLVPGRYPAATAMIQPPVIAHAVEAVVEAGQDEALAEFLPALERYYRYLAVARDPDADGLVSIISQFESGLDYNPAYDLPAGTGSARALELGARMPQLVNKAADYRLDLVFRLNPRHCEDVLVNSVYADGLDILARLAARAGADDLRAWAERRAGIVREQLLERCWDARRGLFFNLRGPRERRAAPVKTIISLFPLLLPGLPADVESRLLEHLADPREFWAPYPVPSVALDEPKFLADSLVEGQRRIWRGPCSMSTNWLLARGLRRNGYLNIADELASRSREMVDREGFNEFYNPLTGAPVGEPGLGWATLAAVI